MTESDGFTLIERYIKEISEQLQSEHAREHAYRPALKTLISSFNDVVAVNDPKRSEYGNPDFIFLKANNQHITRGYAEAKDVTVDLAKTIRSEQLRRYAGYNKLILTNYLDFIFYKNGEPYQSVSIGKVSSGRLIPEESNFTWLAQEIKNFLELPPEPIKSGKRLAKIMGGRAMRIRKSVESFLARDDGTGVELQKMFKLMQDLLIHDLTPEKFADMYAQTLVYGLFIARYNDKSPEDFSRSEARDLVPVSNPFLRDFFDHITGPRFDERLTQIVDELCEVFSVSDVHKIVQRHLRLFDFADEKDPIIHFYEEFLAEYDPVERKAMGAYYTPVPVVRFILHEVDTILKRDFGLAGGLSETSRKIVPLTSQGTTVKAELPKVQILDPAVGTATFLNEIIKFIYEQQKEQGQVGRWPSYVGQHLLPRLYGFELMMVPYIIGHLKLSMTLEETGITKLPDRLQVYLTNTLEDGRKDQQNLLSHLVGFAETVSREADEAARVKLEKPIMVIMGNPPYSGETNNKGLADDLTAAYKKEPGGVLRLNERNPKWINDDYVKFIAFSEHMIAKNGEGVVAMITNHSYLDNPTFRGMRWHLASTFDDIYILDLHGNTKKKETAPDGTKDQNVFDIMQGVAIILAVKIGKKRSNQLANVHHAEVFGTRRAKFDALESSVHWRPISLDKKMYYFTNKNTEGKAEYEKGIALNDLYITYNVGVVTSADKVLIAESPQLLERQITNFIESDGQGKLRIRLSGHAFNPSCVRTIVYRPFDDRYIYYDVGVLERARFDVMKHFIKGKNIGLIFKRGAIEPKAAPVFIVQDISESRSWSRPGMQGVEYNAPLWVYHKDGTRSPNFREAPLKKLTNKLQLMVKPEDVLDYIYGVLNSPSYQRKYQEFLKVDFPRVPVPINNDQFIHYGNFGKRLRELHLMTSADVSQLITTYPVPGSDTVEQINYIDNQVWINDTQYFGGVSEVAWNFYVGGYQPAQKWLKDRKGHNLSNDDLVHYQKIIKVLTETDRVTQEIDIDLHL